MAKDFYFKFYFKDWLVSTQGMDAEVRGWYINLLCQQADKHRLPSDIESLADLAGVKISQFERFKECFQRTLKHKFKQNEDGSIYNEKMENVILDRKESSTKQSKRAIVGVFMKKIRKENDFSETQFNEISAELMNVNFRGLSNEDKYKALSVRFNRMVKAVINNSNYNSNYNTNFNTNFKEKGGVGEKEIKPVDEVNLSALEDQIKCEATWKEGLCRNYKQVSPSFSPAVLEEYLERFFKTISNDGEESKTVRDFKKHFNRWLQKQISKTLENESESNQSKGPSLEYRRKQAERLGII